MADCIFSTSPFFFSSYSSALENLAVAYVDISPRKFFSAKINSGASYTTQWMSWFPKLSTISFTSLDSIYPATIIRGLSPPDVYEASHKGIPASAHASISKIAMPKSPF